MRLIRCKKCGTEFETDRQGKYLCDACALASRRASVFRARTCIDCGTSFMGYPKSKRCSACASEMQRSRYRDYHRNGPKRPLGSTDICQKCGETYIVDGGNQRYCKKCADAAIHENTKASKRSYQANNYQQQKEHRKAMMTDRKVCIICGKAFSDGTPTVTCSEACAKENARRKWIKIDYNRGRRSSNDITPYDSGLPKSGIVGVSYCRKTGKWQASVKGKYIGVFETIEDASAAIEKYKADGIKNK